MIGFLNIIKPKGVTSSCVVSSVKGKLKVPCGHMGTLDPMADGVLPIGLNQAARLFDYLLEKEKTYIADFRFGQMTDTLDITGNFLERTSVNPSDSQIKLVLGDFVGEINQIPPKYSAKYVNGRRGYVLARKGIDFDLEPKKVKINCFDFLGRVDENTVRFKIDCGGGTYIRSLARDLGEKTGSLCIMSALTRTKSGIFDYENGITAEDLLKCSDINELKKRIIPPDEVINFQKIYLSAVWAQKVLDGVFPNREEPDGFYRVYSPDMFFGIGVIKDRILKIRTYVRE